MKISGQGYTTKQKNMQQHMPERIQYDKRMLQQNPPDSIHPRFWFKLGT